MSFILSNSKPVIRFKSYDFSKLSNMVYINAEGLNKLKNGIEIPYSDFFTGVLYVLTNTDLLPNDVRLKFIKDVKKLKIVKNPVNGKKTLTGIFTM